MEIQHFEVAGKPFVIIPKKDYEAMAELAEYADDVATMARIKAERSPNAEGFPLSFVDDILAASNAGQPLVPIWRKYRKMTQQQLAKKVGVTQAYISDIESGKKEGSVSVLKKIAKCLKCDLDDLV